VIPEDFRTDQYVLKPIVTAIMKSIGQPRAIVRVCTDPLLGGYGEALKWKRLADILDERKGMVDLFLLIVDRDGDPYRQIALQNLETKAKDLLRKDQALIGENAWQEVEVWALAGHLLPKEWSWKVLRTEVNPKENYFIPFAAQKGVSEELGGGRKSLAEESARQYARVRQRCPEDIVDLEKRITAFIESKQV
jgi:hypothetical protein